MGTGATAPGFTIGIRSRLASCPGHFTMRKEPTERKLLFMLRTKQRLSECLNGHSTRKEK